MTSDSLDDSKAVADAPMRASDECQQIAIDARHGLDCLRDTLPTFWPARTDFQSNTQVSIAYTSQGRLLELLGILSPQ
jgi:hypothetical protein